MRWASVKLGSIGQFRNGLNFKRENFGIGMRVINVSNFQDRLVPDYDSLGEIDPRGIANATDLLIDGDILFVRSNGNRSLVGRSMIIVDPPSDISFSGFAIRLRFTSQQTHPLFFAYYFRSHLFRGQLGQRIGGTNIVNLNQQSLCDLDVPVPPIHIQRRIASILSAYDDLIENNRRRIALLEAAARNLYEEWFVRLRFPGHEHVKVVNGVPEGWKNRQIADICDTIGGGTPSTKIPEYWADGDVVWFTPTDLTRNDGLILLDSEKKIAKSGLAKSSARMLPPRTILMSSRASIGYFGIYEGEACTNQGFISMIPHIETFRMYLLHNLMWRKEEIIGLAKGSTYKEINKSTFRSIPITIPTGPLLEDFNAQVELMLAQERLLKKQNASLTHARSLLLPRLMSGDIEV